MSILVGTVNCGNCHQDTRFVVDVDNKEKKTYWLGQHVPGVQDTYTVLCDYCDTEESLYVETKNGVVSAFANREEHERYQSGTKRLIQASEDEGIRREREASGRERVTGTTPFHLHPFRKGHVFSIGKTQWKVESIFRREWVETRKDVRLNHPEPDGYWYKVSNRTEGERWVVASNVEGENLVLQKEGPLVTSDTIQAVPLSANPEKPKVVWTCEWVGGSTVEVFQYEHGYRLLLVDEHDVIEWDLFQSTMEEVLEEFEQMMDLEV